MAGPRFSRLGASVALLALALAGCNRAPSDNQALLTNQSAAAPLPDLPATLPMTDAPAMPITAAPRVAALPEARPIRTVRVRDAGRGAEYAYADAAYRFSDALGEAPPDYGFDYQGVEPWAWQGYDDSLTFAEPVSGGYRTYYYRPGAQEPYFVRDPYYSYGYDDGQLAVVYAADGAIVPWADYGPQVVYASRYLMRGRDLWRVSREQRISISAESWTSQRTTWFEQRQQWGAARMRQPMWANYAQQDAAGQSHWQAEQVRRAADTRRFADWQAQSFHAAPPPRAIPVQWQQAPWARDPQRFAPAAAALAGGGAIAVGAVMAHQHAVAERTQQAQVVDAARIRQDQARVEGQQRQQAFAQQRAQQVAHAQQQAQQAVRTEQLNQRREQQIIHAQQQQQIRAGEIAQQRDQQQARAAQMTQRREQQSMRIEQQQARAAEMSQRREQQQARTFEGAQRREQQTARFEQQQQARAADNARREQANAARAQETQARMQQQQARAAQSAQHAQMQAARAQEQHAAQAERAPRPSAPQQRGPERQHDHR